MAHPQKYPLRPPTKEERAELERVSRSGTDSASRVAHAKMLLAVAGGAAYTEAAKEAGRRSAQAVAQVVARFNREGIGALDRRYGGGPPTVYGQAEQERILREVRRQPDREVDGTATWSLSTLQRALRRAPDGLPAISTYVVWCALHDAGYSWQKDQSWCDTGRAVRKRKGGNATVEDPDAIPKKTD